MKLWGLVPVNLKIAALLALISAVGVFAIGIKLKITTLERDLAVCRGGVAEDALEATQRLRGAEVRALEKARKEDHDRQKFITENKITLERDRNAGDGELAPVLRDQLERVRGRYNQKFPEN